MEINDLEKLYTLKEQGIITEEEFQNKKKELLITSPKRDQKEWNTGLQILLSALIGFGSYMIIYSSVSWAMFVFTEAPSFMYDLYVNTHFMDIIFPANILCGILFSILAISYKANKYKEGASWWVMFLVCLLLGGLGNAICTYPLLKIRAGFAEKK